LPATAAQVFGPNTVDPGFNSTGEKTLLTMNTSLPSGGNNIILVSYAGYTSLGARGVFRIYKGSTLLYETRITGEYFTYTRTRPFHHLLIAVDSSPAGNDSYSFRINVTTAASSSASVHVQGMVIKADTAVWGYNTTAVNIASGGTATVTSINTSFPSGSKVAVIATVYAAAAATAGGDYLVGAGNIKLKSGTTVVSSNQFNIGSYFNIYPFRASLIYLDTPTSDSQTYSVEITNGSTQAYNCWAEIVAFDVTGAAFLDTGSVAVGTTQTTVGNLSTTLSGDVVVIALAAAERTATNDGDTFAANAVVLQKDNSSTGQVSNLLAWYIFRTSYNARSGVLPLFRYDPNVSNPSYQVKMTANSGSPNGEAKILAFSLFAGVDIKKVFGETLQLLENIILRRSRFRLISEDISISEASNRFRNIFRHLAEQINLIESGILSRIWIRVIDETINIVEVFQSAVNKIRQVLETLNIVETALTIKGKVLQFSETLQILEAFTRVRQRFREVGEAINLNETLLISRGVVRVFGEFVNLLENIVMSRILNKVVNETERLVESFVSALGKVVGVIENVRIYESTFATRIRFMVINELVRISEVFSKFVGVVKSIVEQVSLLESFKALSNKFRSVGENVRIDEFPSLMVGKFRSFIETVRIGEAFNSFRGIVRQVVEIVNIGEVSSRLSNLFRSIAESVRISEFVGEVRNMFIRVLEDVNVIESISLSRILVRVRDEVTEVGELFSSFIGRVKVVVENVRIIEVLSLSTFKIYIKRLTSVLRGMSRSNLMGSSKSSGEGSAKGGEI
jgi:hypothetical protein